MLAGLSAQTVLPCRLPQDCQAAGCVGGNVRGCPVRDLPAWGAASWAACRSCCRRGRPPGTPRPRRPGTPRPRRPCTPCCCPPARPPGGLPPRPCRPLCWAAWCMSPPGQQHHRDALLLQGGLCQHHGSPRAEQHGSCGQSVCDATRWHQMFCVDHQAGVMLPPRRSDEGSVQGAPEWRLRRAACVGIT